MKFIEKIPNALRWVLALPVALLFSYCARYVSIISVQLFLGHRLNGTELIYHSLDNIMGIAVLICVFYLMIPKYKFISCLVVSIAVGIIVSISLGFVLLAYIHSDPVLNMPLWKYIYSFVAAIITIVYSCVTIYRNEKCQEG